MVIITCSNPYDISDLAELSIDISSETLDVVVRVDTSAVADVVEAHLDHPLCDALCDRFNDCSCCWLCRSPRKVNCDGLFWIAGQLQRQYFSDEHEEGAWIGFSLSCEVGAASNVVQSANHHVSDQLIILVWHAFRPSRAWSSASSHGLVTLISFLSNLVDRDGPHQPLVAAFVRTS